MPEFYWKSRTELPSGYGLAFSVPIFDMCVQQDRLQDIRGRVRAGEKQAYFPDKQLGRATAWISQLLALLLLAEIF